MGMTALNVKKYRKFYVFSLMGIMLAAFYPIYMGALVAVEMVRNGAVPLESYPKYVIPYTPIAIALILGVLMMPAFKGCLKSSISFAVQFFRWEFFSWLKG